MTLPSLEKLVTLLLSEHEDNEQQPNDISQLDNVDFLMDSQALTDPGAQQRAEFISNLYRRSSLPAISSYVSQAATAHAAQFVPASQPLPSPHRTYYLHPQQLPASTSSGTPNAAMHNPNGAIPANGLPSLTTLGWQHGVAAHPVSPLMSETAHGQQLPLQIPSTMPVVTPSAVTVAALGRPPAHGYAVSRTVASGPMAQTHVVGTQVGGRMKKPQEPTRYQCELCWRYFTRPSSLKTHIYSHTGEKPHPCPQPGCNKRFSVRSNLRRHMKMHEEEALGLRPPRGSRQVSQTQNDTPLPCLASQAHLYLQQSGAQLGSVSVPVLQQGVPAHSDPAHLSSRQELCSEGIAGVQAGMILASQYTPPPSILSAQSPQPPSPNDVPTRLINNMAATDMGMHDSTPSLATPPNGMAIGVNAGSLHLRRFSTPAVHSPIVPMRHMYQHVLLPQVSTPGCIENASLSHISACDSAAQPTGMASPDCGAADGSTPNTPALSANISVLATGLENNLSAANVGSVPGTKVVISYSMMNLPYQPTLHNTSSSGSICMPEEPTLSQTSM